MYRFGSAASRRRAWASSSSRVPKMVAPAGQAATQAGLSISPLRSFSKQKMHLRTEGLRWFHW